MENEKKRPGRPRKHDSDQARVNAWRREKRHSGRRLDCQVNDSASWRIKRLSEAWGCSMGAAVERLILEADEKYADVLLPEMK